MKKAMNAVKKAMNAIAAVAMFAAIAVAAPAASAGSLTGVGSNTTRVKAHITNNGGRDPP